MLFGFVCAALLVQPTPKLEGYYWQLPCWEDGSAVSWQIWHYRDKLYQDGIENNVPYGDLVHALEPLLKDSYSWWYAAQLNDLNLDEFSRREALRRLVENIGVQAFERGELPEQCPWREREPK